jgi:subtilisin family serine protease
MRRTVGLAATSAALFLAACQDIPSAPEPQSPSKAVTPERAEGDYIVVFREPVLDPDRLTDQLVGAAGGRVLYRYRAALKGFAATLPEAALEGIAQNPNVAYVEADGVMSAITVQNSATWGIDRIDQRALPLSGTYQYDATGSGVRAYIIDTGVRSTHSEFTGRTTSGFTSINDGWGTNDCHGHGTHVAGTVGGTVYGVAKGVTVVPVRVLGCQGSGATSGVIAGVDWVTANAVKPAVANMSLGGGASSSLDNAVTNSINSGVTYAVAAGNSNANACNYSPARAAAAITVGATTSSDARASYSNFGSCLDVFAPGSSITSAWSTSNTATNTISGTSMSSPHVAGVAALVLQGAPGASAETVRNTIVSSGTTGVVTGAGSGSPNVLLFSLTGGGSPSPDPVNEPPTASFTASCSELTCSFNGSGSTDDGTIQTYAWMFGDGSTGSGVTTSRSYASGGTYTVTLTVTDDDGASANTSQNVTAAEPSGGTSIFVQDITGTSARVGGSQWWRATVTILVHNGSGAPASGVTVTGGWSAGASGSTSCTTGSSGTCSIQSSNIKTSTTASVTWTVGSLALSGTTYDPSSNVKTSVVVARP